MLTNPAEQFEGQKPLNLRPDLKIGVAYTRTVYQKNMEIGLLSA